MVLCEGFREALLLFISVFQYQIFSLFCLALDLNHREKDGCTVD